MQKSDVRAINTLHLNKVIQVQRVDLMRPKQRNPVQQSLALVSTYSPFTEPLKNIVRKHWHFSKRSMNLSDLLVKPDLPTKHSHFYSQIPRGNLPLVPQLYSFLFIQSDLQKSAGYVSLRCAFKINIHYKSYSCMPFLHTFAAHNDFPDQKE